MPPWRRPKVWGSGASYVIVHFVRTKYCNGPRLFVALYGNLKSSYGRSDDGKESVSHCTCGAGCCRCSYSHPHHWTAPCLRLTGEASVVSRLGTGALWRLVYASFGTLSSLEAKRGQCTRANPVGVGCREKPTPVSDAARNGSRNRLTTGKEVLFCYLGSSIPKLAMRSTCQGS